ncbi:lysophospholipid acyltransferase family protein [Pedobacter sp. P351]|uniref:lysophospholipid acyltransferase family protein n=1 Tax=Pedobacter superstes TaxID=3133441 RepID=UPI0030A4FEAA
MLTRLGIFGLKLLSFLPLNVLYVLSDALFIVLFHIMKYRRIVVDENLNNAFPEKDSAERKKITIQYYKFLCDLIIESVKMISISKAEAMERFKFLNPELLDEYFKNNKSVIAVAGHYGNWEMASNVGLITDKKILIVYKPLSNELFERFIKKVRSRFSAKLIPMKKSFREILSYRKEPTVSIIISDQTPVKSDSHIFTSFLNQPTAVFQGIEKLAKSYNYPVVFCDVKVVKRGHYSCEFIPLVNEPKATADREITEAHVKYLEQMIQKEPQYWIWSHKRWKLKPE